MLTLEHLEAIRARVGRRVDIEARVRRLLRLVSPAVRVEPGFLRAVRLLLGTEADAATESDAWQHPAITSMSSVAASLDPTELASLRREFEQEPEPLRAVILRLLWRWRAEVPAEVWFEEIAGLDRGSQSLLPAPEDIEDAERFFHDLNDELRRGSPPSERAAGASRWFRRVRGRFPDSASVWRHPQLGSSLRRLWEWTHEEGAAPPGFDPSEILAMPDAPERRWRVDQYGAELWLRPADAPAEEDPVVRLGSPWAAIGSRNGLIQIMPRLFGQDGDVPNWAVDFGEDEFGYWATFEYREVRQRLRWVPTGPFWAGSPVTEAGRDKFEKPQEEFTVTSGCWLFDTPCTQALWQVVMGNNPSRFRSADRPVENVSWQDVQTFLERLNRAVPGLELTLPFEELWEYACRAGTRSATYAGDLEILGTNNAPLLDAIAWYGGNSGMGFELKNGRDSSDWLEKQYDHQRAGTHPVATKTPNAWGLYDMLGNVLEWCEDSPWTHNLPRNRGVRGGGWSSAAASVRCANRRWFSLGNRNDNLGFRCARLQLGAEPAPTGRGRFAVDRPGANPAGGAVVVRVEDPAGAGTYAARVALPQAASFLVASDCERLRFRVMTRPPWASAIGRDRFGLWVEFEVPGETGRAVRQRLRWIPPGRFWMGSSAGEVGRYDHEGPQHEVTLTQGFWLGDTACTQALWEAVMGKNPSRFKGAERPVENVRWGAIPTFLGQLNGLLPGLDLTLPTEAQWEYACRAGTTTAFSFGESINPEQVNFDGNFPYAGASKGLSRDETAVVRSLPSNAWGLYEMHGNVSEWCIDGQRDYSDAQEVDPWGPTDWTGRAVRGGDWASNASDVRCAFRGPPVPNDRDGTLGFRCARVPQGPNAVPAALPKEGRETEPPPWTGPAWAVPAQAKKRR